MFLLKTNNRKSNLKFEDVGIRRRLNNRHRQLTRASSSKVNTKGTQHITSAHDRNKIYFSFTCSINHSRRKVRYMLNKMSFSVCIKLELKLGQPKCIYCIVVVIVVPIRYKFEKFSNECAHRMLDKEP